MCSTLAQWVGECGEQLQPLVAMLTAELLRHRRQPHQTRSTARGPAAGRRAPPMAAAPAPLCARPFSPPQGCRLSLKRSAALTRRLDDGDLPIDNNWVENRIRPIALGRQNWLFAGSLRAGKRAAAVISLIHAAKLNGLDPFAHLRDVLERLPPQPASRIAELLPHRWQARDRTV